MNEDAADVDFQQPTVASSIHLFIYLFIYFIFIKHFHWLPKVLLQRNAQRMYLLLQLRPDPLWQIWMCSYYILIWFDFDNEPKHWETEGCTNIIECETNHQNGLFKLGQFWMELRWVVNEVCSENVAGLRFRERHQTLQPYRIKLYVVLFGSSQMSATLMDV